MAEWLHVALHGVFLIFTKVIIALFGITWLPGIVPRQTVKAFMRFVTPSLFPRNCTSSSLVVSILVVSVSVSSVSCCCAPNHWGQKYSVLCSERENRFQQGPYASGTKGNKYKPSKPNTASLFFVFFFSLWRDRRLYSGVYINLLVRLMLAFHIVWAGRLQCCCHRNFAWVHYYY